MTEALALQRAGLGNDHPQVATTLLELATLYLETERPERAEAVARQAVAIRSARLSDDHWLRAMADLTLAEALFATGRPRGRAAARECAPTMCSAGRSASATRRTRRAERLATRPRAGVSPPLIRSRSALDHGRPLRGVPTDPCG